MKNGKLQAKDLEDRAVLAEVRRCQRLPWPHDGSPIDDETRWATRWEIAGALGDPPDRVMLAKLGALMRRGLLTGCACVCRGDLEITPAGEALL